MQSPLRALLLVSVALAACGEPKPKGPPVATLPPLPAGESRIDVPGGKIWFKQSGAGDRTPVILVHGGPGLSSYYLKSLEGLSDERKVVRYDQLGAGKSERITDTTLMDFPHYVAEVDALRAHLGVDRVHLVGHSWGAMVALEYYRKYPERVESLTLASPSLDIPVWDRNVAKLLTTLSDSSKRAIAQYAKDGKGSAPGYTAAAAEFYSKYVWRHPVQPDLDSMLATANGTIEVYMKGSAEFAVGGTLKNYDATKFLPKVSVPVLFTVGQFDEADPATVRRFSALVKGSRVVLIPDAAHMTTWDNAPATLAAVRAFLRSADSSMAKRRKRVI